MVLADVMEDLDERGEPFNRDMPVGMMVEVPAAVLMIDHFLRRGRFPQHRHQRPDSVHAGGRSQQQGRGRPVHRQRSGGFETGEDGDRCGRWRHGKSISLCGQMSANSMYTMLLLGLGLRQLSVAAAAIPEIKRVCRSVTIDQCREVAERALALENARDVTSYLRQELQKVLPDLPD